MFVMDIQDSHLKLTGQTFADIEIIRYLRDNFKEFSEIISQYIKTEVDACECNTIELFDKQSE